MIVSKTIDIDTGHRVPGHLGKCKTPHGHRYSIECGVDDKVIIDNGASDEGMVIDFGDLKEIMLQEIDVPFDHSGVFYENDPKKEAIIALYKDEPKEVVFITTIPTAENLAKHWYELMKPRLQQKNIAIKYVKVFETPTSMAIYQE